MPPAHANKPLSDSQKLILKRWVAAGAVYCWGVDHGSIQLSSESLGLTGVLDVLEEKNGQAYPVETKHGAAPRDDDGRPGVWDNDAVQLCGQALLMEEAFGAPVPRGVQYYAGSKERVEVPFTDALRAQTRAAIEPFKAQLARAEQERDEARESAFEGTRQVESLEKKLTEVSSFLSTWRNGTTVAGAA